MPASYQDVLAAICTEVHLDHTNESQHIFIIRPVREAKLAYDIFAAYGFDIHLYPERDSAKLYITLPTWGAVRTEQSLAGALDYALTIKHLLSSMPERPFNITFANTHEGKQISIFFPPDAVTQPAVPPPLPVMPRAPVPAQPVHTQTGNKKNRRVRRKDVLEGGPELAKKYPFGIAAPHENKHEMTLGKWLSTYIFSNFTESFYTFFGMAFAALVFLSLWVVFKAYLCPDLATVKSRAWYCITSK